MKWNIAHASKALTCHSVLLSGAAVMLLPFVWMLVTSVRPPSEIFEGSLLPWPQTFYGWGHYEAALLNVPLMRFMLNGVIICSGILLVQIVVAVPESTTMQGYP